MTVLGKRVEIALNNILFATDFSSAAEKAGLYVKALAERYASKVQLAHVVDISAAIQVSDPGTCMNCFRKGGENSLTKLKKEFTSRGIKVDAILREGTDTASEILEIAKDKSIDLIVSGTRGQEGLARLVFGSMAEQLIHRAECPVLTVGPNVTPPQPSGIFRRIVYATDFSPEATKAAVFALSFAQDSDAHIYLCHVLPPFNRRYQIDSQKLEAKYTAALQHLIPDIACEWCEPECILEHGYAADGILLLAHRVEADLIVLGTRRFSHWFDGWKAGIAYEVIRPATCPVLTVRG
jgi:nucleotide-binding universal stress UspA family protein